MEGKLAKLAKALSSVLVLGILILAALTGFSPYENSPYFSYKLIQHSVTIDAPVDTVFRFLGKSANVARWSVFVDHITPLNPGEVADGSPGSRRRCFCKKNETGMRWDELITEVVPNEKRRLVIYNFVEFPVSAENLVTEQIYTKIGKNKSEITFTLFFSEPPGLLDAFKMHMAAYRVKSIFADNMVNIKKLLERSSTPKRT